MYLTNLTNYLLILDDSGGHISGQAGDLRAHAHAHLGHGLHGHSNIGPVIGKALQILIPSALLITGASALFPNRIHVPTNEKTQ